MSEIKVRFVDLGLQYARFRREIADRVEAVLASGDYILGAEVREFETAFAGYCGAAHALGVADGTAALFLVMKALGIGPGDEVITAANSFIASAGSIAAAGAKPVFVDIRDDFNLDPALLEDAITPATRAIMPVHLTGKPADMDAVLEIAGSHGLAVIEDAAQAVGSSYHGRKVGSFGTAGCFSLHPLKNLNACGDAGVIATSDIELNEKIKKLRNHGLKNRDECEFWGYNSRLDSLQAAILNVRLSHLDEIKRDIDRVADMYRRGLEGVVELPVQGENEDVFYHNFVIRCDRRDELRDFLQGEGVEAKIHYPILLHLQQPSLGAGYKPGDFPVAEAQVQRVLSLPIYGELTEDQVRLVIDCVREFYGAGPWS